MSGRIISNIRKRTIWVSVLMRTSRVEQVAFAQPIQQQAE
jgi:hypothetical protein